MCVCFLLYSQWAAGSFYRKTELPLLVPTYTLPQGGPAPPPTVTVQGRTLVVSTPPCVCVKVTLALVFNKAFIHTFGPDANVVTCIQLVYRQQSCVSADNLKQSFRWSNMQTWHNTCKHTRIHIPQSCTHIHVCARAHMLVHTHMLCKQQTEACN